jgi:hypothetical protein
VATALKRTTPQEVGGTFRIRVGDHLDDGPPGCECDGCLTSGGKNHRYRARRYHPHTGEPMDPPEYDNDIVESPRDLVARCGNSKMERVYDHNRYSYGYQPHPPGAYAQPTTPQAEYQAVEGGEGEVVTSSRLPSLEAMSLPALREYAAAEEIELHGARSKEDVIKAIRAQRAP